MNPMGLPAPDLKKLLEYHTTASRMNSHMDTYELLMMKRSINTAMSVISTVSHLSFEELQLAIFMKVTDPDMLKLTRRFEYQIEEAKLHPDNFVYNLHKFMMKTGRLILENPRNYFEFLDFVLRKQSEKDNYKTVFDGYLDLLLQQCTYLGFLKGHREKMCIGITTDGELLFKDDIYPYSDCASYDMEEYVYKALKNNREIDFQVVTDTYKKYGFNVTSPKDIGLIDATNRLYNNNHYMLISYINEHTVHMLPNTPFNHGQIIMPRKWVDTEIYREKLKKRKYCLPSDGVIAKYYKTGHIQEVHYQEIYKDDRVVLLYKVYSSVSGEFSGYYDTKTQFFYSIFTRTNYEEYHAELENFILENYYLLTCEPTIDKKKLTAMAQVDDIDNFDKDILYGRQPAVCFLYKKKESKRGTTGEAKVSLKHYDRSKYKQEKVFINGYIRKLPDGHQASDEAKQMAIELGYDLEEGYTFVRPFKKSVLKIKEV